MLKIVSYPHPILKYKCKPIKKIDQGLRDIIAEMFDLMYAANGVGLAANQVALPYRLFVMNPLCDPEKKEEEHVFINPVILKRKGKATEEEGCLSFPDVRADVIRADEIEVEAINQDGEVFHVQWKGHPARIVQHENDHLNGVGFVERLSAAGTLDVKQQLFDLQTEFESNQNLGFAPTAEEVKQMIKQLEKERC
jgi:peptide deformylase